MFRTPRTFSVMFLHIFEHNCMLVGRINLFRDIIIDLQGVHQFHCVPPYHYHIGEKLRKK